MAFISENNLAALIGTSNRTVQTWGKNGLYPLHQQSQQVGRDRHRTPARRRFQYGRLQLRGRIAPHRSRTVPGDATRHPERTARLGHSFRAESARDNGRPCADVPRWETDRSAAGEPL